MPTKELFYENQYMKEFEAAVISCEAGEGGFSVVLDATAFYPVGGGQPSDTGRLGRANVLGVSKTKSGGIAHLTDAPLKAGERVTGRIDWPRRFSLMQQHTGEHIVSGLAKKLYGYDNVGFHMGEWFTTMDLNGEISAEDLRELEALANGAVYENAAVSSRCPAAAELAAMEYRSKTALAGDVRIVSVGGYDQCACCGLHVAAAGEIGVIKIVQSQKYKSGVRLYLLCGSRALDDYYRKNSGAYMLSQLFSARPDEVFEAARLCHEENAGLKRQIAAYRLAELARKAESAVGGATVCLFEDGLSPDEARRLCVMLCEKAGVAAVFTEKDGGFRYALGSFSEDARELAGRVNAALGGRGGGQKNLAQGTVSAGKAEAEAFMEDLFESLTPAAPRPQGR